MKIFISYPPYQSTKGVACLTQNRQFQWFNNPSYIPPVVPMTAATMLQQAGHKVVWDDAIASKLTYQQFLENFRAAAPDIFVTEVKTPVVKQAWKIIAELKRVCPKTKIVLMGDHITAMPEESLRNSLADFVVSGGDYDFVLKNLAEALKTGQPDPNRLSTMVKYKNERGDIVSGKKVLNFNLDDAPFIDRDLTQWQLYQQHWFRRKPGTYIMSARDCWWGKCTFCAWTTLYPKYRRRSPKNVLDEIGQLIERYQVKEIMDDAGTIPVGDWLREFCQGMIDRGYNRKVKMNCNLRAGAIRSQADYDLMGKAGFKLLLYGLESVNRKTLDRINKGRSNPYDIVNDCKMAKKAGLKPHLTVMMGYPWETKNDALRTFAFVKKMMVSGLADSLQATVVVPYPGTPLFNECRKNGWLKTEDWDRYDMRESVMKTALSSEEINALTHDMYAQVSLNPRFIYHQLASIKDIYDLKYMFQAARQMFKGKFKDFDKSK